MGRKTVTVYTDDYTGQEIPEAQANEVTLRLGSDEWTMVLADDSEKELRRVLEPFTASAEYKNRAPRGSVTEVPSGPSEAPAGHVITQPTSTTNKLYRYWWKGLSPAKLRQYGLNAPTGDRGRVPDAVKNAYAAAHPEAPVPVIPVIFADAPAQ